MSSRVTPPADVRINIRDSKSSPLLTSSGRSSVLWVILAMVLLSLSTVTYLFYHVIESEAKFFFSILFIFVLHIFVGSSRWLVGSALGRRPGRRSV